MHGHSDEEIGGKDVTLMDHMGVGVKREETR